MDNNIEVLDNNMTLKPEKKKGKGLIILLVLFVLIILGLVGYILYDKGIIFNSKKEPVVIENEKESSKVEELELDSNEVKELLEKTYWLDDKIYEKDSFEANDMTVEEKVICAMLTELKEDKNVEHTNVPGTHEAGSKQLSITKDVVQKRYESIFGKNQNYQKVSNVSVNGAGLGCFEASAYCKGNDNCEDYYYLLDSFGCDVGWTWNKNISKVISAKKYADKIEIEKKALQYSYAPDEDILIHKAYLPEGKTKENAIAVIKFTSTVLDHIADEVEQYYEKADTYKYTFLKDGDNYYFDSAKIVK